jgi:hypothetical protein
MATTRGPAVIISYQMERRPHQAGIVMLPPPHGLRRALIEYRGVVHWREL